MKIKTIVIAGIILMANGVKADPRYDEFWNRRARAIKDSVYAKALAKDTQRFKKLSRRNEKRAKALFKAYNQSVSAEEQVIKAEVQNQERWGIRYFDVRQDYDYNAKARLAQ